jgi:hypothetical protein
LVNSGGSGENGERQGDSLILLRVLEELEKEVQLLIGRKRTLRFIEEKLWVMVHEDIVYKRRKNQELSLEIKKQKESCVALVRGLNASILRDCSVTIG